MYGIPFIVEWSLWSTYQRRHTPLLRLPLYDSVIWAETVIWAVCTPVGFDPQAGCVIKVD